MKFTTVFFSLLTAIFWALAQIAGKIALRDVSTTVFNVIRYTLFTLTITIISLSTHSLQVPSPKLIIIMVLAGIIGWNIGAQLFFNILNKSSFHHIAPIVNTYPLWVMLMAMLFLGEKLTFVFFIASGLVLAGIWLLTPKTESGKNFVSGTLLSILTAITWAISIILTKYCLNFHNLITVLFFKLVIVLIIFWVWALLTSFKITRYGLLFSVLSGLSLIIGEICYMFALKNDIASRVTLLTNTVVPFVFFFSIIFLGEKPRWLNYLAAALIFLGISLII